MKKILLSGLLLLLLTGMGAADTRAFDGFEDGDFTSNPVWSEVDANGNAQVQGTTTIVGTQTLELSTSGTGVETLQHDRGTSTTINDGDIYQFYFRQNADTRTRYSISNSSGNIVGNHAVTLQTRPTAPAGSQFQFITRDSTGGGISTKQFGTFQNNQAYRVELELTPSQSNVTARVYFAGNNSLKHQSFAETSGASSLKYVIVQNNDQASTSVFFDDVSYSSSPANNAPTIDQTDIHPDNPGLNSQPNLHMNASDADGDDTDGWWSRTVDGVTVNDSIAMSEPVADQFEADAFTVTDTNVWHNISFTVSDGTANTTASNNITFRVEDDPPDITINEPVNGNQYTTEPDYTVLFNDTDDVPAETFNWAVWLNGQQLDTGSTVQNFTQSGTVSGSVQGSNTFTANATDDAGNTGSSSVTYTFDSEPPDPAIQHPTGDVFDATGFPKLVNLNYTAGDANPDHCIFQFDGNGTNITDTSCGNQTNIFSANSTGTYTTDLWVNDTVGNGFGHAISSFDVDNVNEIRADEQASGDSIDSFTATFDNGTDTESGSTSNGVLQFNTTELPTGSNDVTITATGFDQATDTITVNSTTDFNNTYSLEKASFTVTVRDEQTEDKILFNITANNGTVSTEVTSQFADREERTTGTTSFILFNESEDHLATFDEIRYWTSDNNGVSGDGGDTVTSIDIRYLNGTTVTSTCSQTVNDGTDDPTLQTCTPGEDLIQSMTFNVTASDGSSVFYNLTGVQTDRDGFFLDFDEAGNVFPTGSDVEVDVQNNDGYSSRTYFLEFTNTTDFTAYLLQESEGAPALFDVVDRNTGEGVEGAVLSVSREFGTEFKVVAQTTSGTSGGAAMFLEGGTIYRMTVEHPQYDTFTGTFNPSTYQFDPWVIKLEKTGSQLQDTTFEYRRDISYNCRNNITQFNCSYISSTDKLVNMSLTVDEIQPINDTRVCNQHSTMLTSTLTCNGLNTSSTNYKYCLTAEMNDTTQFNLECGILGTADNTYGVQGVFAGIMVIITAAMAGIILPEAIIALTGIGVIITWATNIIAVPLEGVIGVIVLFAVLIWRMRE